MPQSTRKGASVELLESRTLMSAAPQVIGYLPDYQVHHAANTVFSENPDGSIAHDNLDWKDLTQVNYFALLPGATPAYDKADPAATPERLARSDGGLRPTTDSGYDPAVQLPAIVADAARHHAKVFATVGAGDANAIYDMDALANTPAAWGTFAKNIQSFCTRFGLAGVDLDWEPTAQPGFTVTAAQVHDFGDLVKTIKTDDPGLKLSAEGVGDPVKLSTPAGAPTGKSNYMLDAMAIHYLDSVNVEAYPHVSPSKADRIMNDWSAYVTGAKGKTDVDGKVPRGRAGQLQYGLDVSHDTTNQPAGVVEAKVDATVHNGFGGLFVFELDSDTGTPSVLSRIGAQIAKDGV